MTSGNPFASSSDNNNNNYNYNNNLPYSFESFLRGWHHRQGQLLEEVTAAAEDKSEVDSVGEAAAAAESEARELIQRVMSHFEEYYEHKSRATHSNVFSLFSPPWCSSLECAFLWITGFRPGILLQLVTDSVHNLIPFQAQALDRLKRETRVQEKQVADDLARIQESAAAPPFIDILRGATWPPKEQSAGMTTSEPIEQLRTGLEAVVANADTLRVTTAASVAEILTPAQGLKFLAVALRVQQSMKNFGLQRDHVAARRRSYIYKY